MQEVVIVEAVRTAIGGFGGTLKDLPAADLGAVLIKEILERTQIPPADMDEVILGNVLQAASGQNPAPPGCHKRRRSRKRTVPHSE